MFDKSLLPQLAENEELRKLMAEGAHAAYVADSDRQRAEPPPDPAAERVRARKQRKIARRLARGLLGQSAPVRSAAA